MSPMVLAERDSLPNSKIGVALLKAETIFKRSPIYADVRTEFVYPKNRVYGGRRRARLQRYLLGLLLNLPPLNCLVTTCLALI